MVPTTLSSTDGVQTRFTVRSGVTEPLEPVTLLGGMLSKAATATETVRLEEETSAPEAVRMVCGTEICVSTRPGSGSSPAKRMPFRSPRIDFT